jgi:hypothetical protein
MIFSMPNKSSFLIAGCVCLLLVACGKGKHAASGAGDVLPKIDACTLLTGTEIQEVQQAPVKSSQTSEHADGTIRVSQCYFAAEPSHRSVSLSLTQMDPAGSDTRAAVNYWKHSFGGTAQEKKERDSEEQKKESLREQNRGGEEKEGAGAMKKIDGVGDEAYWVGSRVGGVLYVLKRNVFIRISLGGPDEEAVKIDKSKKLAQKALDRL